MLEIRPTHLKPAREFVGKYHRHNIPPVGGKFAISCFEGERLCGVAITRDIPAGGTFKVEATNNPFDASPVWEDCTNAVVQGVAHVFTNKINTAAQYGMNIRVTVQRGDALTACWVSGIGGNFE